MSYIFLRIIVDFELVLGEVDVDEGIDSNEQVNLFDLSIDLKEYVVLLEDQVVDVLEVAKVQSSSQMVTSSQRIQWILPINPIYNKLTERIHTKSRDRPS